MRCLLIPPGLAAALLGLVMICAPVHAQEATEPAATEEPAAQAPEPAPPYEQDLLRLSEVLGAVHFLRALCGYDEGMRWRDRMVALIEAEQPNPDRRSRIIARFNRGYETFARTYRSCTPNATAALERYMDEGAALSTKMTQRYGG